MKSKIITIEKEKYICDICGQEFDYESRCREHELSHKFGFITIETRYDTYDGSERLVLKYNHKEYDDLDDFISENGFNIRSLALKIETQ